MQPNTISKFLKFLHRDSDLTAEQVLPRMITPCNVFNELLCIISFDPYTVSMTLFDAT
jgi:hypothetical protein